ncbi:MAG: N-formylglutamate amidohydrolase [Rhizobiaceae bacterium MnEN-MB40S]|nr:MAG: N-formylglutamate amidohydrolase [Rhizobiaceae bacterium MnEN-MB40S]
MTSYAMRHDSSLLRNDDPQPFEVVNGDSPSPVVLVCEHAGRAIPSDLRHLGLAPQIMDMHIAYDIGAGAVARLIADALDAPLVLQPYSRLVIDCNRPVEAADAIPETSDGVVVPGNRNLSQDSHKRRVEAIFEPFHRTISDLIEKSHRTTLVAIHSFTRHFSGLQRLWDVGFAFRADRQTAEFLADQLRRRDPSLLIGMNEPYAIDASDWSIPAHAEGRKLAHSLIEIRNDHLRDAAGHRRWADLLSGAIEELASRKAPS